MKTLKKTLIFAILFTVMIFTIASYSIINISANSNVSKKGTINVGMLFNRYDDIFLAEVRKNLKDIEEENKDKVRFSFFDGKNDTNTGNKIIDSLIQNNIDLLVLSIPDTKIELINEAIYKAKQKSIPVILFNSTPTNMDIIKGYKKSLIIKSDTEQSGILQGNILVDQWNNDKKSIDTNRNNIMQYVMLQGNPNSSQTPIRTNAVLKTIKNAGIETEEIASMVSNWDKETAKSAMETLFLRYGPKIEVVIANNDAMAIGAIETLQKYGYNTGNKLKHIEVVGIDAVPEAQDLTKKGFMLGTITQNPQALAEAVYTVGMNLVADKNPTDGTDYKFDTTGVTILIPHEKYTANSLPKNNQ